MGGPARVLGGWGVTGVGEHGGWVAYVLGQKGLNTPQRGAFGRGYREGTSGKTRLTNITDRVEWWEPVTLLGSALWWVERWVRRNDADTAKADPQAPRQQAYYFDHVIRRVDRLDKLLGRP